jgi:hypothetical protein
MMSKSGGAEQWIVTREELVGSQSLSLFPISDKSDKQGLAGW